MAKSITAGPRTAQTKGEVRRLRLQGKVPISIQHRGEETVHLETDAHAIEEFYRRYGMSAILEVSVQPGGKVEQAIVHDMQRDPVTMRLLQVTLQKVKRNEPTKAHVPIRFLGEPEAVTQGDGIIQHPVNSLEVRCLPANIPDHVSVDVSGLAIGDVLRVADLPESKKYEVLTSGDTVLVSVGHARVVEVVEEEEVTEAPATAEPAPEQQEGEAE